MSVVISGACDPKSVKYQIEQTMKDIPASKEKITAPAFSVPVRTEKDAVIFKDPEMPYIQAQFVSQQEDNAPLCTEEAFRKSLAKEIFGYVINTRLSEITQTAASPWLAANVTSYAETNTAYFNGMAFVPKDGMFVQAMQRLFDEYDRFNLFGVTESELQRAKDYIISSVQQNYDRRSSITSTDRVSAICSQILGGHTCISDQDRYELATKYANEITVDEINALATNSRETASKSSETQEVILELVTKLLDDSDVLLKTVSDVNTRTDSLAAVAQEIAASTEMIRTSTATVKENLEKLINR